MSRTITITDLPSEGAELSDDELAGVAGGLRCDYCHSSKCIDVAGGGTVDTDEDF